MGVRSVYGIDEVDKNVGVCVGNAYQAGHHWFKMSEAVAQLSMETTAGRMLGGSVYARSTLAKGAFASKIVYTFRLQVPFAGARANVFDKLQRYAQHTRVWWLPWRHRPSVATTGQPPPENCGLCHINIESKLQAEWTRLTSQLRDGKLAV